MPVQDGVRFIADIKDIEQAFTRIKSGITELKQTSASALRDMVVPPQTKADLTEINKFINEIKTNIRGWSLNIIAFERILYMVTQIKAVISAPLDDSGLFEKYRTTLGVMLKDTELARERFEEMVKFAAVTPFSVTQVIEAGNQLQAVGRYSLDTLRSLGDLAAASGKPMEEALAAFQALAVGRKGIALRMFRTLLVTYQDFMDELHVKTKKGGREIDASIEDLLDALPRIIEKKGFAGMMDKQMETYQGRMQNLRDIMQQVMAGVGDTYMPEVKKFLIETTNYVQQHKKEIIEIADTIKHTSETSLNFVSHMLSPIKTLFTGVSAVFGGVNNSISLMMNSLNAFLMLTAGKALSNRLMKNTIDNWAESHGIASAQIMQHAKAMGILNKEATNMSSRIESMAKRDMYGVMGRQTPTRAGMMNSGIPGVNPDNVDEIIRQRQLLITANKAVANAQFKNDVIGGNGLLSRNVFKPNEETRKELQKELQEATEIRDQIKKNIAETLKPTTMKEQLFIDKEHLAILQSKNTLYQKARAIQNMIVERQKILLVDGEQQVGTTQAEIRAMQEKLILATQEATERIRGNAALMSEFALQEQIVDAEIGKAVKKEFVKSIEVDILALDTEREILLEEGNATEAAGIELRISKLRQIAEEIEMMTEAQALNERGTLSWEATALMTEKGAKNLRKYDDQLAERANREGSIRSLVAEQAAKEVEASFVEEQRSLVLNKIKAQQEEITTAVMMQTKEISLSAIAQSAFNGLLSFGKALMADLKAMFLSSPLALLTGVLTVYSAVKSFWEESDKKAEESAEKARASTADAIKQRIDYYKEEAELTEKQVKQLEYARDIAMTMERDRRQAAALSGDKGQKVDGEYIQSIKERKALYDAEVKVLEDLEDKRAKLSAKTLSTAALDTDALKKLSNEISNQRVKVNDLADSYNAAITAKSALIEKTNVLKRLFPDLAAQIDNVGISSSNTSGLLFIINERMAALKQTAIDLRTQMSGLAIDLAIEDVRSYAKSKANKDAIGESKRSYGIFESNSNLSHKLDNIIKPQQEINAEIIKNIDAIPVDATPEQVTNQITAIATSLRKRIDNENSKGIISLFKQFLGGVYSTKEGKLDEDKYKEAIKSAFGVDFVDISSLGDFEKTDYVQDIIDRYNKDLAQVTMLESKRIAVNNALVNSVKIAEKPTVPNDEDKVPKDKYNDDPLTKELKEFKLQASIMTEQYNHLASTLMEMSASMASLGNSDQLIKRLTAPQTEIEKTFKEGVQDYSKKVLEKIAELKKFKARALANTNRDFGFRQANEIDQMLKQAEAENFKLQMLPYDNMVNRMKEDLSAAEIRFYSAGTPEEKATEQKTMIEMQNKYREAKEDHTARIRQLIDEGRKNGFSFVQIEVLYDMLTKDLKENAATQKKTSDLEAEITNLSGSADSIMKAYESLEDKKEKLRERILSNYATTPEQKAKELENLKNTSQAGINKLFTVEEQKAADIEAEVNIDRLSKLVESMGEDSQDYKHLFNATEKIEAEKSLIRAQYDKKIADIRAKQEEEEASIADILKKRKDYEKGNSGVPLSPEETKRANLYDRNTAARNAQIIALSKDKDKETDKVDKKSMLSKFNTTKDFLDRITSAFNTYFEWKKQKITDEVETWKKAQEVILTNEENSAMRFATTENQKERVRQQFEIRKQQLDKEAEQRKHAALKKDWEISHALAMAQIVTNTAIGVMSALAMLPPNIPLSIIIGATGATELAIAASQTPPKFAEGGLNVNGKGISYLPKGLFRGVGGEKDDKNLVLLSDNEFIVNAQQTKKHLPLLQAINDGFANGGLFGGGIKTDLYAMNFSANTSALHSELKDMNKNLTKHLENPVRPILIIDKYTAGEIAGIGIQEMKRGAGL